MKKYTFAVLIAVMLSLICFFTLASCNKNNQPKSKYLLKFKSDGANYEVLVVGDGADDLVLPQNPKKNGYAFNGWYLDDGVWNQPFDDAAKITANTDVYAKWSIVNYSITYLDPEGNVLNVEGFDLPTSYTIESETITLNTYYLPGYRFEGWFDTDGSQVATIKKGSYGNIVLTADMTDDTVFSITLIDEQFGKSNPENPTSYTIGEASPQLKPLSKLDYDFVGWTYGLGDTITEIDTRYGGNITLYAVWKQKEEFKPFEYTVSENDDWCILTGVNDVTQTSLVISEVFDMIAPGALKYCQNLQELTLSYLSAKKGEESNSYIGYLFGADNSEKNKNVLPTSLKKVTVNGGTLGEKAFYYCENLEEINVSSAVRTIGQNAFAQCKKLKTLTTPIYLDRTKGLSDYDTAYYYGIHGSDGLTSYGELTLNVIGGEIGKRAFYKNKSIKSISISNVSAISDYAFAYCSALENITVSSLQQIGMGAFRSCTSLKKANFPEGVKKISQSMFYDCEELISVTIPQSVEAIENQAFENCKRLVEVYNLSALNIKKGSSENGGVGLYALDVYNSLSEQSKLVTVDGVMYRRGDKNYVVRYYGTEKNVSIADGTHVVNQKAFEGKNIEIITLPATLEEICEYAFNNTGLQSVTVPQNVNKIGAYAFANNRSLTKTDIASCQITELSNHIFYNCAIQSITIPSSVTRVCESAFERCDILAGEVVLGQNIVKIEANVFRGCDSLRTLTVPFIGSEINDTNAFGFIFGGAPRVEEVTVSASADVIEGAFESIESLKKINIYAVKKIGARAFKNCRNLNTVNYSDDLEEIGANAFENTNINKLILPYLGSTVDDENGKLGYYFGGENSSVPSTLSHVVVNRATLIPANAFDGCGGLSKIDLPATITKIGERAFAGTSLNEMVLNEKVVEIGFGAFAGCESITSITLPFAGNGKTDETAQTHFGYAFGADSFNDHRRDNGTRAVPPSLKNVTILGGKIAGNAFFYCDRIETITFGKNVSEITGEAFTLAGSIYSSKYDIIGVYWDRYEQVLQSYTVSAENANYKTLDGILYSKDGKRLVAYPASKPGESFIVPDKVEEIGTYAFYAQRTLKTVKLCNDVQMLASYAFAGCGVMTTIEFGTSGNLKEIGACAFSRCRSLTAEEQFVIPEGVTFIRARAFNGAYFDRIVLPSTLELIEKYAFSGSAGAIKFNTTCDWDLRNANGYGYGNREVTADTLEDESTAAYLITGGYRDGEYSTHHFYDWIKREETTTT